jgi:hypothetical protein
VGFSGKLPAVIYVDVSSYYYRSGKRKKRKGYKCSTWNIEESYGHQLYRSRILKKRKTTQQIKDTGRSGLTLPIVWRWTSVINCLLLLL